MSCAKVGKQKAPTGRESYQSDTDVVRERKREEEGREREKHRVLSEAVRN